MNVRFVNADKLMRELFPTINKVAIPPDDKLVPDESNASKPARFGSKILSLINRAAVVERSEDTPKLIKTGLL